MRKLLALFGFLVASVGLIAGPASASPTTTLVYYETVAAEDVQFIPACTPGPQDPTCDPRGAGSILISHGTLAKTQGGPAVGTVDLECTTTRKVGADYYGFCVEKLVTPHGKFTAAGEINESALERFEPQTLRLVGARGTLTVQQVVYPNVFRLTINLG